MLVLHDLSGRALQIPHEPKALEQRQEIEGRVIFPPVESLARAALVGMMIVVPALAHGDDGEKPIVAGIVAGDVAPLADEMGERIDAEGPVIDGDRAPEEADDEARPAGDGEAEDGEHESRDLFVAVEPHQLGEFGEIRDPIDVHRLLAAGEDPADMAVDEARLARRMDVEFGVGMEVVVAMVGRPPQDALLRRRLREHCENELEGPAGLIGAVGEVAMVTRPDGEDPQPVKADAERDRPRGDAGPDRGEAREMHDDEGYRRGIDNIGRRIPVDRTAPSLNGCPGSWERTIRCFANDRRPPIDLNNTIRRPGPTK